MKLRTFHSEHLTASCTIIFALVLLIVTSELSYGAVASDQYAIVVDSRTYFVKFQAPGTRLFTDANGQSVLDRPLAEKIALTAWVKEVLIGKSLGSEMIESLEQMQKAFLTIKSGQAALNALGRSLGNLYTGELLVGPIGNALVDTAKDPKTYIGLVGFLAARTAKNNYLVLRELSRNLGNSNQSIDYSLAAKLSSAYFEGERFGRPAWRLLGVASDLDSTWADDVVRMFSATLDQALRREAKLGQIFRSSIRFNTILKVSEVGDLLDQIITTMENIGSVQQVVKQIRAEFDRIEALRTVPKNWAQESIAIAKNGPVTTQINPSVRVIPSSAPPGTAFNQPGQGFTPASSVTVYLQKPDGTQAATQTTTTDSKGTYSNVWIAPSNATAGTYQSWAIDNKTKTKSNVVSFNVTSSSLTARDTTASPAARTNPSTDSQPASAFGKILETHSDPVSPRLKIAISDSMSPSGFYLLRSEDGGRTWSKATGPDGSVVRKYGRQDVADFFVRTRNGSNPGLAARGESRE